MWEGRGKSMGETEKDSLYLDHPPIFLFHVFTCCSAGKVFPPKQKQKLRRYPAVKRASQGQQKGSYVRVSALLDDFIQAAWRRSALNLLSWVRPFCVFRLIQNPLGVLLNTRWWLLGNTAPTSAKNLNDCL